MFKKILEFFTFKMYIGEGAPVKELPTKSLTPEEKIALTQELNRKIEKMGLAPKFRKKKEDMIKIAIDESIGSSMARKLEAKGYRIVVRAGNAEPDVVWMKRALDKGALFIVSPDLDIPSIIERENYPMVWIDFLFASHINPTLNKEEKDEKRNIWVQYVHDRIQAKVKFYGKTFGGKDEFER